MKQIPTAEEILNNNVYITQDGIEDVHDSLSTVADVMIEFAKLHVEAALKAASENARLKELEIHLSDGSVDKDSILNSYPLENIK